MYTAAYQTQQRTVESYYFPELKDNGTNVSKNYDLNFVFIPLDNFEDINSNISL